MWSIPAINAEQELADAALLAVVPQETMLNGVVPIMRQAVRDNFTSSASPDNQNWPPRKIVGDGHPLLIDQGDLLQAATGGGAGHVTHVGPNEASVGVDLGVVSYAAAQNYGYRNKNLPQREFLGMREERQEQAGEIIADAIEKLVFRSQG